MFSKRVPAEKEGIKSEKVFQAVFEKKVRIYIDRFIFANALSCNYLADVVSQSNARLFRYY